MVLSAQVPQDDGRCHEYSLVGEEAFAPLTSKSWANSPASPPR